MAFSPELLSGSDRPQTRGAGACGNKYFSTSALGITLARQIADRGLDKQQASPAEQNALSLGQSVPSSGLTVCLIFKKSAAAKLSSFETHAPPHFAAGFSSLGRLSVCALHLTIRTCSMQLNINSMLGSEFQACSAYMRAAARPLIKHF